MSILSSSSCSDSFVCLIWCIVSHPIDSLCGSNLCCISLCGVAALCCKLFVVAAVFYSASRMSKIMVPNADGEQCLHLSRYFVSWIRIRYLWAFSKSCNYLILFEIHNVILNQKIEICYSEHVKKFLPFLFFFQFFNSFQKLLPNLYEFSNITQAIVTSGFIMYEYS